MKCNEHEIDEVIHFYKDILELDVYNEWDTGIMFDTGSGVIEIFHNGETAPKGTIRHFALDVTDTKALTEKNTNELNNAISSITGLKQENKNINENYTTLNNNYSTLQNNTAELKKNYDELQGNYNSLQGNYTNLQNSYNTLNDNYNEVSKRIQTLQEMVDRLSRNSK